MKWIKKTYLQCIPLHLGVWLSFTVFLALLRNHCYSFHERNSERLLANNLGISFFPSYRFGVAVKENSIVLET